MKCKKSFLIICILICLFSIVNVVASDVNGTTVSNDFQNDELIAIEAHDVDEIKNNEFEISNECVASSNENNFQDDSSDAVLNQLNAADNENTVNFGFNNTKSDYDGYLISSNPSIDDFKIEVINETITNNYDHIIHLKYKYGVEGSFIISVNGQDVYNYDINNDFFNENELYLYLDDLKIVNFGNYAISIKYVDSKGVKSELLSYNLVVNWLEICDEIIFDDYERKLVQVDLPNAVTGNIIVYINNEKYYSISLPDDLSEDSSINLLDDLDFGSYDVRVIYEGNYPSLTLNKIINVTYELEVSQPTNSGTYEHISSDCVNLLVSLPNNAAGKLTAYVEGKTYEIDYDSDETYTYFRIPKKDLKLTTDHGILSYSGDEKYPNKNILFNFRNIPEFNRHHGELVEISNNAAINLHNNESGIFNIYLSNDEDTYNLIASAPIENGVGSIPLSVIKSGHKDIAIEVKTDDYYFKYYPFLLRIVENSPDISVNLQSDNIQFGEDIIINIKSDKHYSDEASIDLDGMYFKTISFRNGNNIVEKLSDLPVGNHTLEISIDEDYIASFNVTVNGDSQQSHAETLNAPLILKSNSIQFGEDAMIKIKSIDEYSYEARIFLDGDFLKAVSFFHDDILTEKISGLAVGNHKIDVEIDEEHIGTVYLTVNGKSGQQKEPTKIFTIVPKITLTLKTVKVKKSNKKLVLQATLKQGKIFLSGKKIIFKFNGKKYAAKTNKKGVAKVTIKKSVLKKLKVGKKVKYQASYGKITAKKFVKVKK